MHALSNAHGFLEMWTKQGHDKQCMLLLARAGLQAHECWLNYC
jgi:hypothetical protein